MGYGLRLLLALVASLTLVSAISYVLISDAIRSDQIENYAEIERADAQGFEELGRTNPPRVALREIDELLDAIGRRPGTAEALLIGPDRTVRASADDSEIGNRDADPNTIATLEHGISTGGQEEDPEEDSNNFEFVHPVDLGDGRYALEVSYTPSSLDAQLADVRQILLLVLLGSVVGVAGLFYVLGGRSLLRGYRLARERATLDGLTDLPNQRAFEDDLGRAVALSMRNQDPLALALLDLDHFKLVNDRHGHPEGDVLLRRIATILGEGRTTDRGYRIGGDEFAVLMPQTDEKGARTVTRRLCRALAEADVATSLGMASSRGTHSADELRAEADAALYEAKRRGGRGLVAFEEIRNRVSVTTSGKRQAVQRLTEEGCFTTVFQPIWDFAPERLLGVEALTRPAPELGLSGPAEAFDIAEQIGRVRELDELCATRALRTSTLPADTLLFVNLAPKTLELDTDADRWLLHAAEAGGIPPERVVLELTERLQARPGPVIENLRRLRERGFKLALDDVGTGNAGLEMLRLVGADYVKLDRTIVAAAATEPNARAVLMAMATFARQTGAFVIAEGIEDEETLEFLRGIEAIDFQPGSIIQGGQGFELGRPSAHIPSVAAKPPSHLV